MSKCSMRIGLAAALLIGMAGLGIAHATPVTMGFDTLVPTAHGVGESVADYYNGGCAITVRSGATGTCGGPDWGVSWSNAIVASSPAADPVPSPHNFITSTAPGIIMNVAGGFSDHLTFAYSAPRVAGSLSLYSGRDGTGTLLASFALPSTNPDRTCNFASFACWGDFTAAFDGVATSAVFGDSLRFMAFDNVSFDLRTSHDVPEPGMAGLFGLGILLLGLFAGLHRRLG